MQCGEDIWSYFRRNYRPSREAMESTAPVVFADIEWTPALHEQSQSRLNREGSITVDEA